MARSDGQPIWIATNHGAIGGGEVMLLRIAEALQELDRDVTIVAPSHPPTLAEAARELGLDVEVLDSHDRVTWMFALRRWRRRHPDGLLWCNGIVPSTATAGLRRRIVHLHQYPTGLNRLFARLARTHALAMPVPSYDMARAIPGSCVLPNWTVRFSPSTRQRADGEPFVVGFLGRLGADKGVHVLAEAMGELERRYPGQFRLRLAGESRFVDRRSAALVNDALDAVEELTDRVGWAEPQHLLDTVDVLAVPSLAPEPFGLVAAEAMVARVPVVVTDAGGLPEVVGEGHGLVVKAGDVGALADQLAALAFGDVDADLDAQAERWETEFSPDAGRERLARLLERVEQTVPVR
ncbi:glycosyltransferase family 4 protein [Microbacterium bovistercoris]|uniref:glycosyltransferase family 4 protein n=1 Tax=Microbacterium bovistercoris TaxID=2293570 RepID=UPI001FEBB6E9|nr:glycosyltransferase family 4 protein [Microbacterium bovistercoris]